MHYKNVTMYGSATQPLREPRGSSSGTAGQISNVRRAEVIRGASRVHQRRQIQ